MEQNQAPYIVIAEIKKRKLNDMRLLRRNLYPLLRLINPIFNRTHTSSCQGTESVTEYALFVAQA